MSFTRHDLLVFENEHYMLSETITQARFIMQYLLEDFFEKYNGKNMDVESVCWEFDRMTALCQIASQLLEKMEQIMKPMYPIPSKEEAWPKETAS